MWWPYTKAVWARALTQTWRDSTGSSWPSRILQIVLIVAPLCAAAGWLRFRPNSTVGQSLLVNAELTVVASLAGLGAATLLFFLWHLLLAAPYQLWRETNARATDAEAKVARLEGRRGPNLVPLYKALHWVARDSVWAENYQGGDTKWVIALGKVFQRALSLGQITAFAYRELHVWVLEPGLTKLESDFWITAELDISHIAAFHPPRRAQSGNLKYDFIEVDFDQVRAIFPPRSPQAAADKQSPVERIGDYSPHWAQQDAHYAKALADCHLTQGERFYRND
jgi:hypothetical protein